MGKTNIPDVLKNSPRWPIYLEVLATAFAQACKMVTVIGELVELEHHMPEVIKTSTRADLLVRAAIGAWSNSWNNPSPIMGPYGAHPLKQRSLLRFAQELGEFESTIAEQLKPEVYIDICSAVWMTGVTAHVRTQIRSSDAHYALDSPPSPYQTSATSHHSNGARITRSASKVRGLGSSRASRRRASTRTGGSHASTANLTGTARSWRR